MDPVVYCDVKSRCINNNISRRFPEISHNSFVVCTLKKIVKKTDQKTLFIECSDVFLLRICKLIAAYELHLNNLQIE